jgi:hypothetical protein
MMKGFVKISKLMGLMLLASGLLFAGCAPEGSSTDSAVSGHGGFLIPVTVDTAKLTMDVGDGAGMATGTWSGHVVGLSNVGACGGTPLAATCTIRVTNLDPDYYMTNTYIALSFCADCAGDKFFSNADLSNGVTVFVSGDPDGTGGSADINGSEYCVVEDGQYDVSADPYPSPYNPTGCKTVTTLGVPKPLQYIHPDCGTRDVDWAFSTATGTNFRFYANIKADWYPEDVTGDGRFDFANLTTVYLTINSLNDDKIPGAANKNWWKIGSYQRSNVLTGYGSGGADYTPSPVTYFALNVMGEYPDRIESYTGVGYTDASGLFSDYEYYLNWSWIIRYDPTVINAVTSNGGVIKGGTPLLAGGLDQCNNGAGFCNVPLTATFTGFDGIGAGTQFGGAAEADGYLYSYNPVTLANFSWNASTQSYQTTSGAKVGLGYADIVPVRAGQQGLIKISLTGATTPSVLWYANTAIIPSGTPDSDPEIGLGMYYFKVLAGTSGRGTQLYADMWTTEGGTQLAWTNGTAAGGFGGGTDDWTLGCMPQQAGFDGTQGCNDALPNSAYWVYHANEVSNTAITQSGFTVTGGGTYQYWNVHLCVL